MRRETEQRVSSASGGEWIAYLNGPVGLLRPIIQRDQGLFPFTRVSLYNMRSCTPLPPFSHYQPETPNHKLFVTQLYQLPSHHISRDYEGQRDDSPKATRRASTPYAYISRDANLPFKHFVATPLDNQPAALPTMPSNMQTSYMLAHRDPT